MWSPPWHLYIFLLANLLAFYLTYLLTFYLAFYLAYLLAYVLAYLLAFYLANLLAFYLAYLLAFYLTYLLAFYLAFYLAYLLAFYLTYLLAFDLEVAVGIWTARRRRTALIKSNNPHLAGGEKRKELDRSIYIYTYIYIYIQIAWKPYAIMFCRLSQSCCRWHMSKRPAVAKKAVTCMNESGIYLFIYIVFFWSSCRENPTNCGRKPWMRPLSFHPGSTNLGPVTCWGCKGTPEDESCCASCGEQGAFVCWPLRRGWGDEGFWGTLGENRCLGTKPGFPKCGYPKIDGICF